MKILQINSVYQFGSTGRLVEDISNYIKKNLGESYVVYGRGEHLNDATVIKFGNKIEQMGHLLKTRIFDRHGFGSKRGTIRLIQTIDKINPDLIMLHNIHGYYLNIDILFRYLAEKKKPVVWLFHDAWPISGHSAHFEMSEKEEIPTGNTFFKQKFEYPASYILNQSRKNYRDKKALFSVVENLTIVSPSIWMTERIKKSFLNEYSNITINNGINTSLFDVIQDLPIKKDVLFAEKKVLLGVASKWTKKKGLTVFNELANILSNEYMIILIGVDKKIKKKLNDKIYSIERTDSIEELVQYYNLANVFINPTFEDNFPTTNIEALCCGTPVITFDTGGSPESIDEFSGIVTKDKTASGILEALDLLEKKQIKTSNCRKRGMLFSKERMLSQYENLFSEIIKGEINDN